MSQTAVGLWTEQVAFARSTGLAIVRFWAIATGRSSEDVSGVSPGRRRRSGGISHLSQSAKPLMDVTCLSRNVRRLLSRAQGRGIRHIACRLERAPFSREVRRNAATRSGGLDYRATTAHGMLIDPPKGRSQPSWQRRGAAALAGSACGSDLCTGFQRGTRRLLGAAQAMGQQIGTVFELPLDADQS